VPISLLVAVAIFDHRDLGAKSAGFLKARLRTTCAPVAQVHQEVELDVGSLAELCHRFLLRSFRMPRLDLAVGGPLANTEDDELSRSNDRHADEAHQPAVVEIV